LRGKVSSYVFIVQDILRFIRDLWSSINSHKGISCLIISCWDTETLSGKILWNHAIITACSPLNNTYHMSTGVNRFLSNFESPIIIRKDSLKLMHVRSYIHIDWFGFSISFSWHVIQKILGSFGKKHPVTVIIVHLRTCNRIMRHCNRELVWVFLLNLVNCRLQVGYHLLRLLRRGFVVNLPKRVKHYEIDQIRKSHPLNSCVISILNCHTTNLEWMSQKVSISWSNIIVISRADNDGPVRWYFLELTHEPVVFHSIKVLQVVSDVACNDQGCESVLISCRSF